MNDYGTACQRLSIVYDGLQAILMEEAVPYATTEKEWAIRASRFLKARLKQADVSYKDLAERLKTHGLEETEASISSKLQRGTFAATFLLASVAALELKGVKLEDL